MPDAAPRRLLTDRRLWLMAAYGFVAGLPLPLSGFTFRLWLSEGGVSLAVIGLTANIGLAYSLKFLWAPLLDNAPPPGLLRHLGRRRGWLLAIQPLLVVSAVLLALSNPAVAPLPAVAAAALVAFLSASQDIVVVDIQEWDRSGLVSTVHVRRYVVTVDELVVELRWILQLVSGVVGQFGGAQGEIRTLVRRVAEGERRGAGINVR